MTPAATRTPRKLRIKTSKTPTQIFHSSAMLMVAGHNFMDNTKRIPLVWNAKKSTELLRNTAKNRSANVPEFDKPYRNEMCENRNGETLLMPRDDYSFWIDESKSTIALQCGDKTQTFS